MAPSTFSQESRVKLYYFLGRKFPKAKLVKVGIQRRYVGGEKQERLERTMREALGRLDLGEGSNIDEQLRSFILNAPDTQLLGLLEMMPQIERELERDGSKADALRNQIDEFLAEIGAPNRFDSDGKLLPSPIKWMERIRAPLDAVFGQEERVAIYHLLEEEFEPEEWNGMLEGSVGGDEQILLEKELCKRLRRLELAEGHNVEDRLKAFITRDNSPRALITMLELMPEVRRMDLAHSTLGDTETATRVEKLRERVVGTLRDIGIAMTFDAEGKLIEATVDKTPRGLKDLAKQEDLDAALPAILNEHPVVSVLFIDLDEFKTVNDRYGHEAGDECLRDFVELAGSVLKGKGQLYRSYSAGDEFIALLPNFNREEASGVAERLRKALEARPIGKAVQVTASIGVASSADVAAPRELMKAAEDAMYASKTVFGKNRVTTFPLDSVAAGKVQSARNKSKGR